mmetsp:Transcript_10553/g.14802  ORF Transcript_10553/g.14802 Transcript_10553/m.14802 type:complete len:156 (-) Transcript_10553:60-527(-)
MGCLCSICLYEQRRLTAITWVPAHKHFIFPVVNSDYRPSRRAFSTYVVKMWYPCGSFKGDDGSAALASNYRDNGLLSGISKNQLDSGVSGSLYRDKDQLIESIVRGYPQLRKSRDELEFGYKLAYEGLSEEQGSITVVKPEEKRGLMDNIKGMFS